MSYNSRVSRYRQQVVPQEENQQEAVEETGDTLDQQDARGGVSEPASFDPDPPAATEEVPVPEEPKRRGRRPMTDEEKAAAKAAREAKKQPAPQEEPPIETKADVKAALKSVEQQVSEELARSAAALKELRAKHLELSAKLFDLNASN